MPSESVAISEENKKRYPQAATYPASEHAAKVFHELATATGDQKLAIYLEGEAIKYR